MRILVVIISMPLIHPLIRKKELTMRSSDNQSSLALLTSMSDHGLAAMYPHRQLIMDIVDDRLAVANAPANLVKLMALFALLQMQKSKLESNLESFDLPEDEEGER